MDDPHLLIFGLGYTGTAVARAALEAGFAVSATTRDPVRPAPPEGVHLLAFDRAGPAIARATHLLETAPPAGEGGDAAGGDPALDAHGPAIAAAPRLRWAGYCSTTGVYGDHRGGWVDEATPPAPGQDRSRRRLAAEQAWTAALAGRAAVDLLRIAGIYGPGRSAFDALRAGRARRVIRPGHAFCRIHRDDIAGAVLAAMQALPAPGTRVLNLADDEPAEAAAVIEEAARLLGVPPPPGVPYAVVAQALGPMARSFWQENRKVASVRTQAMLGRRWRYRGFREGLRAILAAERQDGAA